MVVDSNQKHCLYSLISAIIVVRINFVEHSDHNIAILLCTFSKICGKYSATYLAGTSA